MPGSGAVPGEVTKARVELDDFMAAANPRVEELLILDEALTRLAERDPQAARLVDLHCFAGLPVEQAAAVLGISPRTAYRDWAFAQAWLYREVRGTAPPAEE